MMNLRDSKVADHHGTFVTYPVDPGFCNLQQKLVSTGISRLETSPSVPQPPISRRMKLKEQFQDFFIFFGIAFVCCFVRFGMLWLNKVQRGEENYAHALYKWILDMFSRR